MSLVLKEKTLTQFLIEFYKKEGKKNKKNIKNIQEILIAYILNETTGPNLDIYTHIVRVSSRLNYFSKTRKEFKDKDKNRSWMSDLVVKFKEVLKNLAIQLVNYCLSTKQPGDWKFNNTDILGLFQNLIESGVMKQEELSETNLSKLKLFYNFNNKILTDLDAQITAIKKRGDIPKKIKFENGFNKDTPFSRLLIFNHYIPIKDLDIILPEQREEVNVDIKIEGDSTKPFEDKPITKTMLDMEAEIYFIWRLIYVLKKTAENISNGGFETISSHLQKRVTEITGIPGYNIPKENIPDILMHENYSLSFDVLKFDLSNVSKVKGVFAKTHLDLEKLISKPKQYFIAPIFSKNETKQLNTDFGEITKLIKGSEYMDNLLLNFLTYKKWGELNKNINIRVNEEISGQMKVVYEIFQFITDKFSNEGFKRDLLDAMLRFKLKGNPKNLVNLLNQLDVKGVELSGDVPMKLVLKQKQ